MPEQLNELPNAVISSFKKDEYQERMKNKSPIDKKHRQNIFGSYDESKKASLCPNSQNDIDSNQYQIFGNN